MRYLLVFIYLIFTTGGIFLFKAGGNSLSLSFSEGIQFKLGYVTFLGFVCYLCSFLLWQKILVIFDISYIVPITSGVSQIIIFLVGILIFQEKVNLVGVVGTLLVITGVVLITIGKN